MKEKIIINEMVSFLPDENRLEPLGDGGVPVSLNVPVSRCLLLLISRAGDTVSQNDFLHEVWESKGQFGNVNTYFQNIHLLRKALKTAGIKESVIKTIPKEGLRFTGRCTFPEDAQTEDTCPEDAHDEAVYSDVTENVIAEPLTEPAPVQPGKGTAGRRRWWFYVVCILPVSMGLVLYLYSVLFMQKNFYSDYISIGEMNQCQVYSSRAVPLKEQGSYLNFFRKKNIACQADQHAYITVNTNLPRISVIICDNKKFTEALCLNKIYSEGINDD